MPPPTINRTRLAAKERSSVACNRSYIAPTVLKFDRKISTFARGRVAGATPGAGGGDKTIYVREMATVTFTHQKRGARRKPGLQPERSAAAPRRSLAGSHAPGRSAQSRMPVIIDDLRQRGRLRSPAPAGRRLLDQRVTQAVRIATFAYEAADAVMKHYATAMTGARRGPRRCGELVVFLGAFWGIERRQCGEGRRQKT